MICSWHREQYTNGWKFHPRGVYKIPIRVQADLFNYLEGDNPRAMLNFALNLVNAGDQASQLTLKIKPSVLIGTQEIPYPDYFNITKEFKSGN